MEGLFIFLVIVGGIVYGLRYLRRREVDKFRDADVGDFRAFSIKQEIKEQQEAVDPMLAKAQAYAAMNPDAVKKPSPPGNGVPESDAADDGDPEKKAELDKLLDGADAPEPVPIQPPFRSKQNLFDEITRTMLAHLARIVPRQVVIMTDVPLSDLAVGDASASADQHFNLSSRKVSYVLYDIVNQRVICGIQYQDQSGALFAKGVFSDIGVPLLEFPLSSDISELEVREALVPVFKKRPAPKRQDP